MPMRRLVVLACLLATVPAPGHAEDEAPRPFEAWEAPGLSAQAPQGTRPRRNNPAQSAELGFLELPLPRGPGPLDGKGEAAAREGWTGAVAPWLSLAEDRGEASAALVRPRGPFGAWRQARSVARELLAGLPPGVREVLRGAVDAQAQALLTVPPEQLEAAWRQVLARWPGSQPASLTARLLGEALLERGELDAALLVWRAAQTWDDDPRLRARMQALRVRLRPRRAGSLAAPNPEPARTWGVRWARVAAAGGPWQQRPLAADGERLFMIDGQGVLAVDRELGLLCWRTPVRGDPATQRLSLARGLLLLLRPERMIAIRAHDGAILWERRLAATSRLLDAVATPAGFAVLLDQDGNRCLQGWTDQGTRAWELKLWRNPERATVNPVVLRLQPHPEGPDGKRLVFEQQPPRQIDGDGRLACLADRVFVTIDGLVLCASAVLGELVWLQDAAPGRAVQGPKIQVQLSAGPYALEAVTGLGLLVRLDPLTGASLPLPRAPEGAAEAEPWVLALDPSVLLYRAEEGYLLTCGAPGEQLMRLALGPPAPGVVHGGTLCLPDPEGVLLIDLASGTERGVLPWALGWGPLQSTGGLLVAGGPRGLAVLGGGEPSPPPPPDPGQDPADWIGALDARDWRTRLLAQERLLALEDAALPALEAAAGRARTLDARDLSRDLVERFRLRRLLHELAPGAPPALFSDVGRGVRLAERLADLRKHVKSAERGSPELSEQVLEVQDPAVRWALLEILLRVDGKLRDALASVVVDGNAPARLRQGCADALVELAASGGPEGPFRRAYEDPRGVGAEAVVAAILARRDPALLGRLLGEEVEHPDEEPEDLDPLARQDVLDALPALLPRR